MSKSQSQSPPAFGGAGAMRPAQEFFVFLKKKKKLNQTLGLAVKGVGLRVYYRSGFSTVQGLSFRVSGPGVWGLGSRGLGF